MPPRGLPKLAEDVETNFINFAFEVSAKSNETGLPI